MAAADHIIARQKIMLRYRGAMPHYRLQQQLKTGLEERLPQRLSEVFDELVPEGDWLQIDRMSIHITAQEAELAPERLSSLIAELVKVEVAKAKAGSEAIIDRGGKRKLTEAVQHYLLHGFFPWWISSETGWNEAIEAFLENKEASELYELLQPVITDENARARLHSFFVKEKLEALLEAAFGWPQALLKNLHNDFRFLYEALAISERRADFERQWQDCLLCFATRYATEEQAFYARLAHISRIAFGAENESVFDAHKTQLLSSAILREALRSPVPDVFEKEVARPMQTAKAVEQLITESAGIVLLVPFIPQCFRQLGLLNDDDAITDKPKAIALLRYLSGAGPIAHEGEAALEKILCGIPLQQSISPVPALNDVEIEETKALLEAVISQWTSLRNTSVGGLQEGFLQRVGMIMQRDENWMLQVPQQAQDILLQRLPWNYKMIRTKWMKSLLTVEW